MSIASLFRLIPALVAGWLLLSVPTVSAAAEAAGHVIVASGTVQAHAADGAVRELRRRSPFFAGDTIRTAVAAEVQLRFVDGAVLALRPESEFRVDEYRFDNHGGTGDRSVSTLLKGGLRTITGVIGKQDPQAYQVKTPVATIGVRGTHYEAVLESPRSLVLAAWQGGIHVRNERGAIDLGTDAAYNFARAGTDQPPQGLLEPPPALQSGTPVGQAQPDKQQAAATVDADAEQDDGEAEQNASGATADSAAAADAGESDGDIAATETAAATSPDNALSAPIATLLDTGCSTCTPPQQIVINQPSDLPALQDQRFTTSEWAALQATPYLGIWVEANNTPDYGFDGGRVLEHGSNSPVLTENGYGPHEPQYATAPILDVVRRGGASVDAFASYAVDSPAYTVYWGTWNGNVNPYEIQIDPTDGAVKELSYAPLHWATLLPTDAGVIAARTGTVAYNNVVVAHGGGSGGGPLTTANMNFNANVNFDTGAITSGVMNIYNGPEIWNVNFAGQVRANVLDVSINNTSSVTISATPKPIQGDMGFAFTGSNGQAIGGGFSLQGAGDPQVHVEGVLLVR